MPKMWLDSNSILEGMIMIRKLRNEFIIRWLEWYVEAPGIHNFIHRKTAMRAIAWFYFQSVTLGMSIICFYLALGGKIWLI